jgi:putative membrane protein
MTIARRILKLFPGKVGKLMRMKFATVMTAAVLVATLGAGGARAASSDDQTFVSTAQSDLLGQYALAALARSKASNATAKSLASEIATNADTANNWLKKYAASHNISLSNKPPVRADMQYGTLQSSSGSSFDQQFAQDINVDTQMQISDFQDAANSASDPALKSFAKQQVTALQKFTAAAQKLSH